MPVVSFAHDRQQIVIPVAVLPPDGSSSLFRFERANGLIDTGASITAIRPEMAARLDLPRQGKTVITTPSGEHMAWLHTFRLGFYLGADDPMPFVIDRDLIGITATPGSSFDVLIGMDVIGRGDLRISRDGSGQFSFG